MIIDKILLIASSIIEKDKKVLLLQRGNNASYPDHWQLPEGKIEEGETSDLAIKREIKEEIGIRVISLEFQKVFYSTFEAKELQYLGIRAVYKAKLNSNEIMLSQEHKNYGWYSKKEALKLLLIPGIKEILQDLSLKGDFFPVMKFESNC